MPGTERFRHGTRARYVCKCRCEKCTAANTEYVRQLTRRKIYGLGWNGLVPAEIARCHLRELSRQGIGRHTIADAAGIPSSSVHAIKIGQKKNIRALTERKILEVDADAVADHALVDARKTWTLLRRLLREGYTRQYLARHLGSRAKVPSLQIGRRKVLARTSQAVRKMYKDLSDCDGRRI